MKEPTNNINIEDPKLKIEIVNSLVELESFIKHHNKTNYISVFSLVFLLLSPIVILCLAILICASKNNSECNICCTITQILNTDYSNSWCVIIVFIASILLISKFLLAHSKRMGSITEIFIDRKIELEKLNRASNICDSIGDEKIQYLIKSQLSLKLAGIGESKYIDQDINDYIIKYNKFNTAFEKEIQGDSNKSQQVKMHLLLNLCGVENSKEIIKGMSEAAERKAKNDHIITLITTIDKIENSEIRNQTYQLVLCSLLGVEDLKSFLKNSDECEKKIAEVEELIDIVKSINNNNKEDKTYKDILFFLIEVSKDNGKKLSIKDIIEEIRIIIRKNNQ